MFRDSTDFHKVYSQCPDMCDNIDRLCPNPIQMKRCYKLVPSFAPCSTIAICIGDSIAVTVYIRDVLFTNVVRDCRNMPGSFQMPNTL